MNTLPAADVLSSVTLSDERRRFITSLTPLLGDGEARAVTRLAIEIVTGWSQVDIAVRDRDFLSEFLLDRLEKVLARLMKGEPVQYVVGFAPFHGNLYRVTPATLIPRPETSQLVDIILDDCGSRPDLHVFDIATGSGCIAIALARSLPFARVEAIDISPEAIDVARDNASRLRARVDFSCADMLRLSPPPTPCFDVIVSNPPYITPSEAAEMERSVLDFEPHTALFAPASDPILFYRAIAGYSVKALKPGSALYLEINPLQADTLVAMLLTCGFASAEVLLDDRRIRRFIVAKLPSQS
ncbi:MAG: peptide chain release factor N(5)-glutamine methyltransferase [Muribaculaceae bacterium]|nr:peptide chain release factor N(5)-glutamine methyltransferase [Muribaculaceae bacterium]